MKGGGGEIKGKKKEKGKNKEGDKVEGMKKNKKNKGEGGVQTEQTFSKETKEIMFDLD